MVSYAIVTLYIRRDLHDPLRFFEVLRPVHFYYSAPYHDMTDEELAGAHRYATPVDLYWKLRQARPDIVQGGEPFVRRLVPYAWAVQAYARQYRKPYVVPSVDNIPAAAKYGPIWAAAVRAAMRSYVREAALDIAINKGAETNLLWAGAHPERVARMMYGTWGVDTTEFSPDGPKAELPGTGKTVMFLGRIDREKGIFDLVEAAAKVMQRVEARVVMLGDGPDVAALKEAVARAGLADRFHLLGTVANKEVPSYLRSADILVAPSRTTPKWAEQVGMSAIQAIACGVPVVSTTSGSIPEFIEDGVSGLLVNESDPDALASAMIRLLSDDSVRNEFSRRARQEAVRRFDARTNIRQAERRILEACGYQG